MNTVLGLGVSNWLIWVAMILFIVIYFAVAERINRSEDRKKNEKEEG